MHIHHLFLPFSQSLFFIYEVAIKHRYNFSRSVHQIIMLLFFYVVLEEHESLLQLLFCLFYSLCIERINLRMQWTTKQLTWCLQARRKYSHLVKPWRCPLQQTKSLLPYFKLDNRESIKQKYLNISCNLWNYSIFRKVSCRFKIIITINQMYTKVFRSL